MWSSVPSNTYTLAPLAEIDLEEIWFYTFQTWSFAQADNYFRDLLATFEALGAGDRTGRDVDVRPGYLKCPVGSHMVYFRERKDCIEIIRVLHQWQDISQNL
ncbi:type II toxin-antitoxin system RelE/ParE family toxin [Loktanella atrilutea]|nr:type II toxin-antitoxin system RelE/ParE family toxin [Loktanella atrilutea]